MLSRTEMSFCSASTSNHFNIIKNNKSKRIVFPTLLWSLMIACFLVLVQPFCSFAEGTGLFGDGRLTLYANHESKSQSLSCIIETGEGGLIVIDGGIDGAGIDEVPYLPAALRAIAGISTVNFC